MKRKLRRRLSLLAAAALVATTFGALQLTKKTVDAADPITFDLPLPDDPTDLKDGNYRLTADVYKPITISDDAVVNLNLNGYTVDGGSLGSAITVGDDAKLCLYDTVGTGRITGRTGTRHSSMVGGAGIYVNDDASLEMYGGTVTECVASSAECAVGGAGVYIKDGASFYMAGGTISKCRCVAPTGQYGLGAGVYGAGTLILSSGVIEENGDYSTRGGGVYTTRSMYVSGNVAMRRNTAYEGGGVYLNMSDNASFLDMSGGAITDNAAATATRGAGVYVQAGGVRLSGTADISTQLSDGEDIRFANVDPDVKVDYRFCHQFPTKSGYTFELHDGTRTGTNITALYHSDTFKSLSAGAGIYVVWASDTPTSPTPSSYPTLIPVPTATVTPTPTMTPTATPEPTPTVTPTPDPTATPTPSYGPGEGQESEEYQSLSETDRSTADELVKCEPTISYVTAARMVSGAAVLGVTHDELLLTDSTIRAYKSTSDPAGTTYGRLQARATKRAKTQIKLSWKKVTGADGYAIYGNLDDKKHALSLIKTVGSGTTTRTVKSLKKQTAYKYMVVAYKNVDNTRMTIAAGVLVHELTKGSKTKTTVKKLQLYQKKSSGKEKLKSTSLTIKKGSTMRITATMVPVDAGLTIPSYRGVRFESMNTGIVRVSVSKGKLTPVSAGKAVVYVYAQNGVYKKLTVTIK